MPSNKQPSPQQHDRAAGSPEAQSGTPAVHAAKPPIEEAIDNFVVSIAGVRETAPFLEHTLLAFIDKHKKDFEHERDTVGTIMEKSDSSQRIAFPPNKASRPFAIMDKLQKAKAAKRTLPNMLLLALVSQYDAYLANLLKALFHMRPEIILTSDRQVRFSDISNFDSIENVKTSIVEKEIEAIIRESHAKQVEKLEKLFKTSLTKDLDIWTDFIEITERRNLLAHTNGVVSAQYIANCTREGVPKEKLAQVGKMIAFSEEYFENTYDVLLEMCIKLGHVLWRKINPDDVRSSDVHYNQKCFELIKSGQYKLAIKMLDFMCDVVPKHSGQDMKLYMEINRCNAHRLEGNSKKCIQLLDKIDTSALGPEFKLAEAILRNDYEQAAILMKQIGERHPDINQFAYSDWPIFWRFRDDRHFLQAYEEIFGEKFAITTEMESVEAKEEM